MSSSAVLLSVLLTLSPTQKTLNIADEKLVGKWIAIHVTDTNASAKNRVQVEQAALRWNSVQLLPNHKFEAKFTIPMHGTWTLRASRIILIANTVKDSSVKPNSGMTFSFKPEPIELVLDKEGKSLTRIIGTQTIVFQKKS